MVVEDGSGDCVSADAGLRCPFGANVIGVVHAKGSRCVGSVVVVSRRVVVAVSVTLSNAVLADALVLTVVTAVAVTTELFTAPANFSGIVG